MQLKTKNFYSLGPDNYKNINKFLSQKSSLRLISTSKILYFADIMSKSELHDQKVIQESKPFFNPECFASLIENKNAKDILSIFTTDNHNELFLDTYKSVHSRFRGAAANNNSLLVDFFLNLDIIPIDAENGEGKTALYYAAEAGHFDIAKKLLENGACLNSSEKEYIPVHIVAKNGHTKILELFLEYKADLRIQSEYSSSLPIHIAAEKGQVQILKILIANGISPNETRNPFWGAETPLSLAAENGHLEAVLLLLKNGAKIFIDKILHTNPLYVAAQNGYQEIIVAILNHINPFEKMKYLNSLGFKNRTMLHAAAYAGNLPLTKFLCELGADLNIRDEVGFTPLSIAIYQCTQGNLVGPKYQHEEIVYFLKDRGAEEDLFDIELIR